MVGRSRQIGVKTLILTLEFLGGSHAAFVRDDCMLSLISPIFIHSAHELGIEKISLSTMPRRLYWKEQDIGSWILFAARVSENLPKETNPIF
jgi:hypothetical protein